MRKPKNRMDLVEQHFLLAGETIAKMVDDFKKFEKEMENSFKITNAKSKKHKLDMQKIDAEHKQLIKDIDAKYKLEMKKIETESKKRNQKHEDKMKKIKAEILKYELEIKKIEAESKKRDQEHEDKMKKLDAELKKLDAESKKRDQEHEDKMKKLDAEMKEIDAETKKIYQQIAKGKKELDKALKNMSENVGGIGNSNGYYTEEFFCTALEKDMSFAGHDFDYMHKNLFRYNKRKNLRGEYDIVLVNHEAIIVFELKYKLTKEYVKNFYHKSLKKFKALFPEYDHLKLYGAVASMSDPYNARQLASSYGLYVATKQAQKIKVIDKNVCEYLSDNLLEG